MSFCRCATLRTAPDYHASLDLLKNLQCQANFLEFDFLDFFEPDASFRHEVDHGPQS